MHSSADRQAGSSSVLTSLGCNKLRWEAGDCNSGLHSAKDWCLLSLLMVIYLNPEVFYKSVKRQPRQTWKPDQSSYPGWNSRIPSYMYFIVSFLLLRTSLTSQDELDSTFGFSYEGFWFETDTNYDTRVCRWGEIEWVSWMQLGMQEDTTRGHVLVLERDLKTGQ